jgi:hypothetical protein
MHRDNQTIDIRGLTADEWDALRRRIVRRAHAERARVIGEMLSAFGSWLRQKARRALPVVQLEPAMENQAHRA